MHAAGGRQAPLVPLHTLHSEDRQRRAAAEAWLYRAATSRQVAGVEWADQGIALLTAGIVWDAVRLPYGPLGADLERDADPDQLGRRLHELQVAGPVFCDPYRPFLYFLVPPGTEQEWPRSLDRLGVACLGGTRPYVHHVGVPRLDRISPPGPYWLSVPDGTGQLVDPRHLYQVLQARADDAARPDGPATGRRVIA
ncbi:hypothetical protein GCM10014715_39560 [Streptomyces spiralis]|uniref:DNA primase/polymerase bifunctional N-terminal domain-containing protein n=1 Tax=Streptomyces spiralis TaxID=66376 RepID=A0A919A0N4_9ACTN|nr:hypothetical protein [Streptomyces spiralis]GHE80253.1 hypothetical protein GCM10014715_39560 [Streptomyces spiralis]